MRIEMDFSKCHTPEQAKQHIDNLYDRMLERARGIIPTSRFMSALSTGTLPSNALQLFWLNWHGFVAEINNFVQLSYQFHLGFWKENIDLMAPLADRIADEIVHPKSPGHLLLVWKQGEVFGVTREQMLSYPMLPACRILLDWHKGLIYEGTMAEFWSSAVWEEYVGYWARDFRGALLKNGYREEQLVYFRTHEEADLKEHEGTIGHGMFTRIALQRMLEKGMADFRPGYSPEYCALTSLDLFRLFLDAAFESGVGKP